MVLVISTHWILIHNGFFYEAYTFIYQKVGTDFLTLPIEIL